MAPYMPAGAGGWRGAWPVWQVWISNISRWNCWMIANIWCIVYIQNARCAKITGYGDAVGRQFEPYPYRRFIDGPLVV